MIVKWKLKNGKKKEGETIGPIVKAGKTYLVVKGTDGLIHEVPIKSIKP
tara:strand:+ start:2319 stop:2465 length:147 start_codon:yes stop_codon:yes gene_type:complete